VTKQECQLALAQLGAEEQKDINDVWYFAGHWFKIAELDDGTYEIVEL
jgi:hypothetical protein